MIKKRERAVFLGNRLKVIGMMCINISTGNEYALSKLVQECLSEVRIYEHMAFERQKARSVSVLGYAVKFTEACTPAISYFTNTLCFCISHNVKNPHL